jgi:hypothetical protein
MLDGTGLLLGTTDPKKPNVQLVSSKTQDLSAVVPPDYSYGGTSPTSDRQEPYESLALGFGMRIQDKWQDFRYAQAMGVDLSVWPWCKGPQLSTYVPPVRDSVAGVRSFFELGGKLYCAQGRYVLKKADGVNTWAVVKDFGGGIAILNTAVFTSNFDGLQRAWFALSAGPAQYTVDGATYTPMATFSSLAFLPLGREFWWADDVNRLRKCDTNADPTNEDNYTNLIFRAGDKGSPITNLLATAAGTMVVAKTDGLYTLDATGDDHPLFPFLKMARSLDGGKYAGQFENSLYISYGRSFLRLNNDLSLEEIGPERMIDNSGPVRGQMTAFCGVGDVFAYGWLYNPDTFQSHLMKFGGFVPGSQASALSSQASGIVRVDVWHGSLIHGVQGVVGQALFESSIDAPAGHTRTWSGFSDGSIGYMINPCSANPPTCSAYLFDVGDGWVELPIWHGTYHASRKSLRHFAITGPKLDANNFVTIDYKLDPTLLAWTTLPNQFDSQIYEEAQLPTDATAVLGQFRVHLQNVAATASPLVSAFAVGHALRPNRYMSFECDILCADGLVRRDGVPLRIGRNEIQHLVEQAVDNPGAVTVVLPTEQTQQLSITDYSISQAFDEIGRTWRGSLHIKAVQWSPEAA